MVRLLVIAVALFGLSAWAELEVGVPEADDNRITVEEIERFLPGNVDNPEEAACIREEALSLAAEIGDPALIPDENLAFATTGRRARRMSEETKRIVVANNIVLRVLGTCHERFN